jgi:aspartate racemase
MNHKFGIIGGAGVAATNKLQEIIEVKLTKSGFAFRDAHHPEMIIYQATNSPSRSMFLEGKGENFIPSYIDIAKKLSLAGANILCMSCNTAHYAIEDIQKDIPIKIINLIEEIAKVTLSFNTKKIGLIASEGCLLGKVYEKYFNFDLIYPDLEVQKEVTKGICNTKNKKRFLEKNNPEHPNYIFNKIVEHLYSKGAEKIIIGCTDIRVDFFDENTIDSLEVLANTIIKLHINSLNNKE